jgi:LuxR family maltose regulon positive regulatory protein
LDEAALLLNDTLDLHLSQQDVSTVEERTEGWIAGLQMAALSLQGRDDRSSLCEPLPAVIALCWIT